MGKESYIMGNYFSSNEWWRLKRVSDVSITKARTRCWSLTISLEKASLEEIKETLNNLAKSEPDGFAACFSEEEGTQKNESGQGYRHAQCAVFWPQPQTGGKLLKIFKPFRAHIEPAISQEALCDYVKKSDTHISGPYAFGAWDEFETQCKEAKKNKGKRTDLIDLENAITSGMTYMDIMNDPTLNKVAANKRQWIKDRIEAWQFKQWATRNRSPLGNGLLSVDYISGDTGLGKTELIHQLFGYATNVFVIDKEEQYLSAFPFNTYQGQSILLLDEYKSQFSFENLLGICYANPYELNIKNGAGWGGWLKVFICSPAPVTQQYNGGKDLTKLDGSICQLYRRLSCGRVIELKKEYGKPKLPYATAEDCIMGRWDNSIYPSKSIEEATMIDWRTGESLYRPETRQRLEAELGAKIAVDDDDEDWGF